MKTNKNVYSLFIIFTNFIFYFIEYIVNLVAEKKVEMHLCADRRLPERWLPWLAGLLLGEKVDSAAGVIGDLK
jgi:hypothetical protein